MKLEQLRGVEALVAVAERGGFTAAALQLRISPSAVSQAVKELERRLGAPLLSRTTRSVALTPAGRQFVDRCGPALREIGLATEAARNVAGAPAGTLRLNLSRAGYGVALEPWLPEFMARHPQIHVELRFDEGPVDIVREGFDAGVRLGETVARDMTALRLTPPFRFVVAGSPRYFAAKGRPVVPEDLLSHDCLLLRFSDGDVYDGWEFERKRREIRIRVGGRLTLNDSPAMIQAARRGIGLIYHSDLQLAPALRAGKLELVLESYSPRGEGHFLYYPGRAQATPALRALLEFLKSRRPA